MRRTLRIVTGVIFCRFCTNRNLEGACRVLTQGALYHYTGEQSNLTLVNSLVFGYSKFKGKQKQIVEAAYCGGLTRHPAHYMR